MNIALELFNNERKHLSNDDSILRSENFYRKHTVVNINFVGYGRHSNIV